jgi:hypothetical protein
MFWTSVKENKFIIIIIIIIIIRYPATFGF